jgi:dihydroxyacetone kinase-like protein
VLYRRVHQRLGEMKVEVQRRYLGEYATSLEMAGASLTVMRLDERLVDLLDHPARSPFFRQ